MRFDIEALRQALAPITSFSVPTLFAAGGVGLAVLVVAYGTLRGVEVPADAVAVTGPTFTPVAITPPAPTPASKPSGRDEQAAPRFEDAVSVTRAVQAALRRAGCYSGPVNGVWTASTRASMGEFTARVNARLPVDRPDPVLLALLETHNKMSCGPPARKPEIATRQEPRAVEPREEDVRQDRKTPPPEPMQASIGADDAANTIEHLAPKAIAPIETASTANDDADASGDASMNAAAAAAAVAPAAALAPKVTNSEPRRAARKYKKQPSLSRQVSKGFKSLQRSLNKLF